jgi:intracellular sulfur oxidation DsrE/DsrF family protein
MSLDLIQMPLEETKMDTAQTTTEPIATDAKPSGAAVEVKINADGLAASLEEASKKMRAAVLVSATDGEDTSEFALTANSSLLGALMTILGVVVTVAGPVITALSQNPVVQGNTTMAGILSGAGVLVMACGVALKALTGNAYVAARTQLKIAHLNSGK